MTPEERADRVVPNYYDAKPTRGPEDRPLEYWIAQAIREAVEAEREACAAIPANLAFDWCMGHDHATVIAAAIRARSTDHG